MLALQNRYFMAYPLSKAPDMPRFIALSLLLLITGALDLFPQEPEWLLKIPSYYRLKGGYSYFCVDPTRNTVLYDGGAYDTYASSDGGETWRTIFDNKMFHIDNSTTWMIDHVGRWYYEGRVYGKIPVNLVTEDAGESIRYLMADTGFMGKNRVWGEVQPRLVQPNAVVFDRTSFQDTGRGVYVTTDAGRSFKKIVPPSGTRSVMFLRQVKPGVFAMSDSNWNAVEIDVNTAAMTSTDVDARYEFVRLADNSVVQGRREWIRIRRPGDTAFTIHTTYTDPISGTERPAGARFIAHVNDTLAVIFGLAGETFVVGQQSGLRVLNAPINRSRYQTMIAIGMLGDLMITLAYVPEGTSSSNNEYTVYNVRTGALNVYQRPGYSNPMAFRGSLASFQIIPVSATEWLASFRVGEFVRTTNAGKTWTYMDKISQNKQWGEEWVGLSRLFPRGDGTMAVLSEPGRLMLDHEKSGTWEVILPGPFTHKIRLPNNVTSILTQTQLMFGEDFSSSMRYRYGPSTVFFPVPDEIWVSGDVLTRFTSNGEFIDTVLPRKTRMIKQISPLITVAAMDSVYFSFNGGKEWVYVGYSLPVSVNGTDTTRAAFGDVVVADNGNIVAGLRGMRVMEEDKSLRDTLPGGLVISRDNGDTWQRTGMQIDSNLYVSSLHKSSTGALLCVASEVYVDPWMLDFQGNQYREDTREWWESMLRLDRSFVYRSTDHGQTWALVLTFPDREKLGTTDIRFASMPDGRIMVIHPTYGVAISANDGITWSVGDPLYIGNPVINDVVFTNDGYAHFATDQGYARLLIENIVSVPERSNVVGDLTAYINSEDHLKIFSDDEILSVSIMTIDGRMISTTSCQANSVEINAARWSNGAYLIAATTVSGLRRTMVMR